MVEAGKIVKVDYIGKFENGTVFDTSIEDEAKKAGIYNKFRSYEPFSFVVGEGQVIEGFDNAVLGMKVGEEKEVTIPPEKGYSIGPLAGKTLIFKIIVRDVKEPKKLSVVVVNDKRCKECDITGIIDQLQGIFPGLEYTEIDYSSDEGKKLYNELNLKYLPAILFDESVKEAENYKNIERFLEPVGEYLSLRIGASFDPNAEICDNGIDDNGDGLIDCEDPTCEKEFVCMPKKEKPEVELFVMAYCPFGTQIEKGILPVAELLGDKINLSVKFCSYAMHGKKELDEQILQYCIQKEQKDKYLSYLRCFLKEGKTDECLKETSIDQEKLNACIEQTDKKFKITENYEDKSTWLNGRFPIFDIYKEENEKYGIRGSPGLVINGAVAEGVGRDPASLLGAICLGFKEKPEECNEKLSSITPSPGFGFSEGSGDSMSGCSA
ncbi:MAG TPA: hypothetical protein ENF58_03780 [Candidatus Altiarchaeales archaeon]|nr:hypothetical protein [Candidatus Altiarchaeales archaeon]